MQTRRILRLFGYGSTSPRQLEFDSAWHLRTELAVVDRMMPSNCLPLALCAFITWHQARSWVVSLRKGQVQRLTHLGVSQVENQAQHEHEGHWAPFLAPAYASRPQRIATEPGAGAGCAAGARLGTAIDRNVLHNQHCRTCGQVSSDRS